MYNDTSAEGIVVIVGLIIMFVGLAVMIFMVVTSCKIFKKAGIAQWKAIIPVYNTYCMYKIAWNSIYFWILVAVAVVNSVITNVAGRNSNFVVSVLSSVLSVALLVLYILLQVNLAKVFGKGGGFAVGLILLPVIFQAILAFGSAEYVKNRTQKQINGDDSEYRW